MGSGIRPAGESLGPAPSNSDRSSFLKSKIAAIGSGRSKRTGVLTTAGVMVGLLACLGQSFAQGLGGLGQLLGGGGGSRHHQQNSQPQNSPQTSTSVTVQRDVTPFVGKFTGKQKDPSSETDLNAEFACYPASDAALPKTKAFVCYTAEGQARMPSSW